MMLKFKLQNFPVHVALFSAAFVTKSILGFSALVAPESTPTQRRNVQSILDEMYGSSASEQWEQRRSEARSFGVKDDCRSGESTPASSSFLENIPQHELVYGELGLDALATILDAVGVEKGDNFMDIGAGDGMLVTGASMLYSSHLESSEGVEIVPDLFHRSIYFQTELEREIEKKNRNAQDDNYDEASNIKLCPHTSFYLGNVYEPQKELQDKFAKTTLAVCFATTWSRDSPGRKLNRLSEALGQGGASELQVGARLVVIDGVLNYKKDGFQFEGELKLQCPDTAPYSIARLYKRI